MRHLITFYFISAFHFSFALPLLLLTANFVVQRPKDVTGTRYIDGSRSPSFYTASPAESDTEAMTRKYWVLCSHRSCGRNLHNKTLIFVLSCC